MKKDKSEILISMVIKRTIIYLILATLLSGALFLIFYLNYIEIQINTIKIEEKLHAQSLRQTFEADLRNGISDLSALAWHDDLLDLIKRRFVKDNRTENNIPLENELIKFLDKKQLYDQVRFINSQGMEIIRINYNKNGSYAVPSNQLQSKINRYYFKETITLSQGSIFVSPLDLNIENKQIELPLKPMIRFSTPIIDEHQTKHGIIILNYFAAILLDRIKKGLSQSAQAMLVNSDGYWLVGRSRQEEWGFMYKDRSNMTFPNAYPKAWKPILAKNQGQFKIDGILYTYETVFPGRIAKTASSDQLQNYFMKIISRRPINQLNPQIREFRARVITLFGFILLLMALISWILALAVEKRKKATVDREKLIEELQEAVDNIKTLSGLVPICASCKKIRDDQGYWNQIESYIEKHSDAQFSHGICQECAEELYGDQEWYKKRKK